MIRGLLTPAEYELPHLSERCRRQHSHRRFGLAARRGFDAHFGHAERAMQHVLDGVDVLNAGIRNVALAAEHPSFADHQFSRIESVPEGETAGERCEGVRNEQKHQPEIPVASARTGCEHDRRGRQQERTQVATHAEEER
jgi:hypothetical protein